MEACVLVLFPRASACVQADQSNGVSAPQRSLREKASACFAWSAFSRRRTLIVQFRLGSLVTLPRCTLCQRNQFQRGSVTKVLGFLFVIFVFFVACLFVPSWPVPFADGRLIHRVFRTGRRLWRCGLRPGSEVPACKHSHLR